ncbi:MAG: hypothetical protein ACREEM_56045 [Blastocatellia bacterium]
MKSRFTSLLQPKKDAKKETPSRKTRKPRVQGPDVQARPTDETETQEITVRRAIGKRSKADYTQVSAYIPKDTHRRIKGALLDDGRDFSELISDLLAEWLDNRG